MARVRRKPTKKQRAKIAAVMKEFGKGKLRSSSGKRVTSIKQALAISYSEAKVGRKKK